jgi:hypothetical protein
MIEPEGIESHKTPCPLHADEDVFEISVYPWSDLKSIGQRAQNHQNFTTLNNKRSAGSSVSKMCKKTC